MNQTLARAPFSNSRSVAAALWQDVLEGNYVPHTALPSVREIAERFNVGERLARNALSQLVQDGIAYTLDRQGTFVSEAIPHQETKHSALRRVVVIERSTGTHPAYNETAYFDSYRQLLDQHGVEMHRTRLPLDKSQIRALFPGDIPRHEQGALLVNAHDEQLMAMLNDIGVHFVVQKFIAYSTENLPPHASVVVNKVAGAFDMTNYLLGLGHRRIGFIGTNPHSEDCGPSDFNVYEGFAAALRCNAMGVHTKYLANRAVNDPEEGMRLARAYFERPELPTAILAQCDMQAACLLRAAKERGIRVPEELSIVGFDGLKEFADSDPPLTTVNDPRRVLAREAMQLLIDIAEDPSAGPVRRVISCPLTIRQSAGPAPADEAFMHLS